MKKQEFTRGEYATAEDYNAIGNHVVETAGNIVNDLGGYPHHYAGVTVSQPAASTIRINPGQLYIDDKLYDLDKAFDLNLIQRLPSRPDDAVWVAILLRGELVTDDAQRIVLIDADTKATAPRTVPKVKRYTIEAGEHVGEAGPTPLKPSVAATACIVAWVLLKQTGIATIETHIEHRVKSLYEVEGRVTIVEGKLVELEQSTKSIRTDLSAVSAAVQAAPRQDMFAQALRDIGAFRRALRVLETEPRAYMFDPALVKDKWDIKSSEFYSRIREGIRFPFAAYRDSQLTLLAPATASSDIAVVDQLLLPKFREVPKLVVEGGTGEINISQLTHIELTAIRREVSRSSTTYGPIVTVCQNTQEWASIADRRAGESLTVKGETFVSRGLSSDQRVAEWNATSAAIGHQGYDVQSVSVSSWTEVYWDYVTEIIGLNGSCYGQTWLNAQAMIMTGLRLRFTKVGSEGDVHALVCETTAGGQPDFSRVIGKSTLTAAQLQRGKVKFPFRPMLKEPGKRYAFFLVSNGNHAVATVSGNKYAQGSSYQMSDGAWMQASLTEDIEMEILGAEFAATRTVVEMQPLTLENGMSYLRLIAAGWAPAGTRSTWEICIPGGDVDEWLPMTPENASVLYGLPAMVRLRLVLVGTTDLAPAIVLDSKARAETGRTAGSQKAITKPIAFGLSTTGVTVDLTIDQWRTADHTAGLKLVSRGVTYTPTATSLWQDPDNPRRRRLTANFRNLPATDSVAIIVEGTKSGVDEWFGESLFVLAA